MLLSVDNDGESSRSVNHVERGLINKQELLRDLFGESNLNSDVSKPCLVSQI